MSFAVINTHFTDQVRLYQPNGEGRGRESRDVRHALPIGQDVPPCLLNVYSRQAGKPDMQIASRGVYPHGVST